MNKILYITYDGVTDPLGQSQILPYLNGLSANGYDIHILSFEKKNTFLRQKDAVDKIIKESNITWHHQFFTTRPKYISKFYDLHQLKKVTRQLHQKFHFDAVHCRSYIAAQAGLLLKNKFGVKLVFDMRGFWIDERIENGQWDKNNFIFRLLIKRYREIEKALLKNADSIITLTKKAKEHLIKASGVSDNKITIIPCCVDMVLFSRENIDKSKVAQIKQQLCISDEDYLVVYSGSLGGLYLIEETMLFFKRIKQYNQNSRLLVLSKITPGQLKPYLDKNNINEKDVLLRWSSRIDMPCYLALSKIALCFIRPSFSKIASCPTKLPEYLAMGIPTVINAGIGDDDEIIRNAACGVILQSFTEPELEKGIAGISSFLTPQMQAIQCATDHYSLETGISRYLEVYKKIFN